MCHMEQGYGPSIVRGSTGFEQRGGDLHSRKSNMGVFLREKEKDGLHVMKIRLGSQVCSA